MYNSYIRYTSPNPELLINKNEYINNNKNNNYIIKFFFTIILFILYNYFSDFFN
jgi:hypothetical protein